MKNIDFNIFDVYEISHDKSNGKLEVFTAFG